MEAVGIWTVGGNRRVATQVSELPGTETEMWLEELIVNSPDLLGSDFTLIGRQVSTEGGPLDLLALDGEGRLVVVELKRGLLTREAVAQILDYVSYVADLGDQELSKLVEGSSGKLGIDPVENFLDWYAEEFPQSEGPLEGGPRMLLVGVGTDPRSRRMVNYLAEAGLDIRMVTFQAFQLEGHVLLARKTDTRAPRPPSGGGPTRDDNLAALRQLAEALGVWDLLQTVAEVIREELTPAYEWPNKTSFGYSFPATTAEGRPTQWVYVKLALRHKEPGAVHLRFTPRSAAVAREELEEFADTQPKARTYDSKRRFVEFPITASEWEEIRPEVIQILRQIGTNWEKSSQTGEM